MYVLKYIYLYYVTKINNDSLQKQYVRINKNIRTYKINFEYSNLIEARPNDYQGFILAYCQRNTISLFLFSKKKLSLMNFKT